MYIYIYIYMYIFESIKYIMAWKATNKNMYGRSASLERRQAKLQIIIHLRAILGLCGPFFWKNYDQ